MFDADRPITKSTEDCLNRTLFAKYLARCMLDHHHPDSFVVGLYGAFGTGKTSIINLLIEELNTAASNMIDDEKPIILSFSPWSYSGQNQLIYSFFRRLSAILRNSPYVENKERLIYLLELYVSFFTHQPVPKSLRTKHHALDLFAKFRKTENYGWESGRDLTLVKTELNELLKNQKHKIIILIDNISRLYDKEIKQIFQIVKSMGDYANTIYLLAFDKNYVIEAIDHIDHGHGKELIEKIVQLPFEVPPIALQDLESILNFRLKQIMPLVPSESWNNEYWSDIYFTSLKYFFENCRDITRYINTLNFSYPRVRDMVNPVDFFAITAVEVFLPDVYSGIRDNKDLFTDLLDKVYVLDVEQIKKDKTRCDEILSRTKHTTKDIVLELLCHLFPRIRLIYHPETPSYHSDAKARKFRRICSPDLFDLYFRLSMLGGQIHASEFKTLLQLAKDSDSFDHALARLNQDERITQFLDHLDSKTIEKLSHDYAQPIIDALLDNGDLFPKGVSGPLSLSTPMRIHRIIHRLLKHQ